MTHGISMLASQNVTHLPIDKATEIARLNQEAETEGWTYTVKPTANGRAVIEVATGDGFVLGNL